MHANVKTVFADRTLCAVMWRGMRRVPAPVRSVAKIVVRMDAKSVHSPGAMAVAVKRMFVPFPLPVAT